MAEPDLVARCVDAMIAAVDIPVTVKTRTGVDQLDSPSYLAGFIETVAKAGCRTFIVHARKAWLKGLSPKENREIPPLHYERVHELKTRFPALEFILNGGIISLQAGLTHMGTGQGTPLDGVMIGRAAYDTPYLLADADRLCYGAARGQPSRAAVFAAYVNYVAHETAAGTPPHHVLRHAAGLFHACSGARQWRQAVMSAGKSQLNLAHLVRLAEQLDVSAVAA